MNATFKELFHSLGEKGLQWGGGFAEKHVKDLNARLIAAGEPGDMKGIDLFGIQIFCALVFPVFWGFVFYEVSWVSFLVEGPKQVLVYMGLLFFGFYVPTMNVGERAKARQKSIALQLPNTLDLLTISVEAGLDFMSAMRRVVEKHPDGPLKEELERFFKQTELGRPRRESLREMANRVQLSDLNAVVSALIQADRLGVSIGPILTTQSNMLRIRRAQRAEKAAGEAPVKMLAPLMICILPSVFIMVLAPVIIQMIDNLHHSQ
ncbi:MAG TPA: type II secretion system F family protein [Candidatus Sulfotelmatobacter sp.]|jgi:tight adherence protein C|nr:type II secretion system F family protein [Candidatus Sulfotelmatobacter sp.]